MHEINVIRGPGGCFSLFVNVPHAENMPRAVSTGLQNSKKAFLLNLLVVEGILSSASQSLQHKKSLYSLFFPHLFIPLLPGQHWTTECLSRICMTFLPATLSTPLAPSPQRGFFLPWLRKHHSLAL